ncbi:MAG: hypothetical protein ACOCYV_03600 [Planctomycetota bacterium]
MAAVIRRGLIDDRSVHGLWRYDPTTAATVPAPDADAPAGPAVVAIQELAQQALEELELPREPLHGEGAVTLEAATYPFAQTTHTFAGTHADLIRSPGPGPDRRLAHRPALPRIPHEGSGAGVVAAAGIITTPPVAIRWPDWRGSEIIEFTANPGRTRR